MQLIPVPKCRLFHPSFFSLGSSGLELLLCFNSKSFLYSSVCCLILLHRFCCCVPAFCFRILSSCCEATSFTRYPGRKTFQGPVVRSLVSTNRWLRGIKTYRFPWYLTLVSANHVSSNPGQKNRAQIPFQIFESL